jgi:hypothetical protein
MGKVDPEIPIVQGLSLRKQWQPRVSCRRPPRCADFDAGLHSVAIPHVCIWRDHERLSPTIEAFHIVVIASVVIANLFRLVA